MAESTREAERAATRYSIKWIVLSLVIFGLLGGGAWFALTTGLERLPKKMCDGAVDRDLAIRALPRTRTAHDSYDQRSGGTEIEYACRVYTSAGSILTGRAGVNDVSPATWVEHFVGSPQQDAVKVSVGGIEAMARLDRESGISYVYVPCVPRDFRARDASESYAVTAEASVIGDGRVSGAALRQAVTDFAYQVAVHTVDLAQCQGRPFLPGKLPRYPAQ
ncbi:hypothetical protein [Streptomyces longwoodensis]|uniref:hypothetical protein n=1 Tax=Streptomyces longwoodensis TaxID=68231 RepID=UPI0038503A43